jgi:hypothetical protein
MAPFYLLIGASSSSSVGEVCILRYNSMVDTESIEFCSTVRMKYIVTYTSGARQ